MDYHLIKHYLLKLEKIKEKAKLLSAKIQN